MNALDHRFQRPSEGQANTQDQPTTLKSLDPRFNKRSRKRPKITKNLVKIDPGKVLEQIYRDLDNITLKALGQEHSYNYLNPYLEENGHNTFSARAKVRYLDAEKTLGTEAVVVAMHSPSFRDALQFSTTNDWLKIHNRILENRGSLKMFAIMRHIPYFRHYEESGIGEIGSINAFSTFIDIRKLPIQVQDAEQAYLTEEEAVEAAKINDKIVEIAKETVYDPEEFNKEWPPPYDWPSGWEYPTCPAFPGTSPDPKFWTQCFVCYRPVMSERFARITDKNQRCICKFDQNIIVQPRPLVEIYQFTPIPGDPGASKFVNRGVRAVSRIRRNQIIGEYTGLFKPVQYIQKLEDKGKKDEYAFAFVGPHEHIKGIRKEDRKTICYVTSELKGNWTRFINQKGLDTKDQTCEKDQNCRFIQLQTAGRNRILVQTIKDINFGDEITAYYGESYFDPPKIAQRSAGSRLRNKTQRDFSYMMVDDSDGDDDGDDDFVPFRG